MRRALALSAAIAATWCGASLAMADDIAIFNTGVGTNGQVLAPGNPDPHYTIAQVPSGFFFPVGDPATVANAHPAYAPNDAVGSTGSSWIAPYSETDSFYPPGTFVYRTTFSLAGLKPSTAHLWGAFAVDNTVQEIRLNGVSVGFGGGSFRSINRLFDITTGFQDGVNTIDFVAVNLGDTFNPAGLRVVIHGTADPAVIPDTTAPVISGVADHAFEYTGSPVALDAAALGISALDDRDGTVAVTLSPDSAGPGTTLVTASAHDAAGNTSTAMFTVTVADTTAPAFLSLSVSPDTIDDRCHRMVPVTVTAQVSDTGDAAPQVKIVSITSSDDDEDASDRSELRGWWRGGCSGRSSWRSRCNDAADFQITGDLTAQVRGERSGRCSARTYAITVEAKDASGNATTATVVVVVRHDEGRRCGR